MSETQTKYAAQYVHVVEVSADDNVTLPPPGNPYDFLERPAEDVYSVDDGEAT